ncbi:MAG: hypothetical protein NTW64_01785 [Candidatus Omnitrophica bacterium]|nr:hypothetical protein [Candidatus Omnitrophota bacterium]
MILQLDKNKISQVESQLDNLDLVRMQLESSAILAENSRHLVTTMSLPELNTMEGSMFSALESIQRILKLKKR